MNRKTILLMSGPNVNLFGQRDESVYGAVTIDELIADATSTAEKYDLELEYFHSNSEGELVTAIQQANDRFAAIIINPGALTHYAWSLHDALSVFKGIIVEVHLSNINAREPWRHTSVVAPVANGSIIGFGRLGYVMAVEAVERMLNQ